MAMGKHECSKPKTDPTYNEQWSGVSYAPHASGKRCSKCGSHVHKEAGEHYCPRCDDYVKVEVGGVKP